MKHPTSSKPGVGDFLPARGCGGSPRTGGTRAAGCMVLACLGLLLSGSHVGVTDPRNAHARAVDPDPPSEVWKSSQSTTTLRQPFDKLRMTAQGIAYYVRPDGGSPDQCTGLVNAAYPGSGTGQPCAWNHPFQALPPDGTPRIAGGDTLIIAAGEYMMGYGAPGADNCESDYPWDCYIPPLPSGPDPSHPTRILGAGWDAGCPNPPELWGTERADVIINLTDASNVEVACLELTDHSSCVEFHAHGMGGSELACERDTYPFGPWAAVGLYAEDSANVHLRDLNIHGLAAGGVHAGRLTDWTVEDVRIAGNGWVGWDGDIDGSDSNSGTMTFRRWTVEWNGCGETYPGEEPTGCWAQTAGGYGDGVGTGATGGDWIIEDSAFLHNTSDGLDLLYHSLGGSITINRVRAEGNAGNQIKVTGQATLINSVLVGNCAFFDGQPFTYNVDPCRALGNTLSFSFMGGETASMINNTLYGQGDGLVGAGPREGGACNGSETLTGRNNLYLGDSDYFDPGDLTFLFYTEGCPGLSFDSDYSLYHHVKLSAYTPGPHDIAADPQLSGPLSGQRYGMELTADSPAIDAGTSVGAPGVDFDGNPRPLDGDSDGTPAVDVGADEFTLVGDLDYDCDVDVADIMEVADRWNLHEGETGYDPLYDADDDGDVDVQDVMWVAAHWGDTCQTGIATVWAVDDGEKIKQDELGSPLRSGASVWDGTQINVFGARNEVVAFQLIIEAGSSGASDVNVSVTDPSTGSGHRLVSGTHHIANDFTLPGADQGNLSNSVGRRIELFREHYLNVTEPSRTLYIADIDNLNGTGWWPDPLIPLDVGKARGGAPFDIAPNRNQAVWVDIYIPKGTPAGRYSGTVTVTENDGANPQAIPLTLTVYDFTLPDENHLRAWAYIADPWRIVERHGLDNPGSEAYYQVEKQYAKMAHRHRLDAVTDRDLEWVTANEVSYLDGSLFSAANGYEGPGEGFGVQIFPPVIDDWGSQADFNASVNGWYDWFTAHGLDWSKAIYYVWDEPGPNDYDWIKGRADWDHALAHPIKIFLTEYINPALIKGSDPEWIDFWCPPASEGSSGYDIAAAAERRAAGYEVGVYNGHRPGAGTILIDDDAIAPRTWGWIAFKHDVDLWYLWDVAYWRDYQCDGLQTDLWNDPLTFDCENRDWENVGNGDGTLFYPGQDVIYPDGDRGIAGPISSVRMKNWRQGMQDYEYLWLARSLGHGAEVEAIVAERVPAVLSDATGLPVKSWSSRGADWEVSRRAIAALIVGD